MIIRIHDEYLPLYEDLFFFLKTEGMLILKIIFSPSTLMEHSTYREMRNIDYVFYARRYLSNVSSPYKKMNKFRGKPVLLRIAYHTNTFGTRLSGMSIPLPTQLNINTGPRYEREDLARLSPSMNLTMSLLRNCERVVGTEHIAAAP